MTSLLAIPLLASALTAAAPVRSAAPAWLALVLVERAAAATVPVVPLCEGLTIVTAINDASGDYETIKTVTATDAQGLHLRVSAQKRVQSVVRNLSVVRTVSPADLSHATLYMHYFDPRAPVRIPGSTALGVSTAVLRALKTRGVAEIGLVDAANAALPADSTKHPNVYDFRVNYTLKRLEPVTVTVPVTINGERVELPAIHARGEYLGDKAEFYFLDDERNPMTLRFRIVATAARGADADEVGLQVVKISHRCESGRAATAAVTPSPIERALVAAGRVNVYDIYFDFNSERLREESAPTLREITALLQRHADWKLAIDGHTDSIGGAPYNLDLSRRRAAAVKAALVAADPAVAMRLTSGGSGASRPRDTNDTLEGRARNRRVELVRQP